MSGKPNYLEMSDEEFLKLQDSGMGAAEQAAPETVEPPVTEEITAPVTEVIEAPKEEVTPPAKTEEEVAEPPKTDEQAPPAETVKEGEGEKKEGDAEVVTDPPATEGPDLQAFYDRILSPLKANGRTIEIKDADDAIRLMQMGAGFGRKMHDIQPHLKTLRFLEQNNLLTVGQEELAFLVDLKNKNPDAIRKLVKDSGIDPLDFNNEEEVQYKTNIPQVTDQQVVFREALDNLATQEGGQETIRIAQTTWDAQSHQDLMENPGVLDVIHEQRQIGIYDRIVSEMDRQKALGRIPHSTPFLQAYKQVGDHLRDTNGFADLIQAQGGKQQEQVAPDPKPQLLDTRVAAPKPSVQNSDKAKAAASTKTTPKTAQPFVNPLAMSDEEFQKQYGNRY